MAGSIIISIEASGMHLQKVGTSSRGRQVLGGLASCFHRILMEIHRNLLVMKMRKLIVGDGKTVQNKQVHWRLPVVLSRQQYVK